MTEKDLNNPKYRKGYTGRLYTPYPPSWDKKKTDIHPNFKYELASYYRAGQYVGLRGELMTALKVKNVA